MRFSHIILLVSFACLTAVAAERPSQVKPKEKSQTEKEAPAPNDHPTSFWMQKKLEYSQSLLQGLAKGDFQTIRENSEQMRMLSKVEGFVRSKKPGYRTQLHTFERLCSEMSRQADRKNLEGVNLVFNQLTVSCVSCHQLLRANEKQEDNIHTDKRNSK